MPSKTRQELYDRFLTGSKPNQDDFVDLIDSMINTAEDGIGASEKGKPMEIIQQGNAKRLLDFSSSKDTPIWRISALSADGARNGLNFSSNNQNRLFVKQENGFTGINTDDPSAKLHVIPDTGAAFRVDDVLENPSLVIDGDGSIGIGSLPQAPYNATFGGTVNFTDLVTLNNQVYAENGMNVNGALLKAQQGLKVQNGATIETGSLNAKEGLSVTGTFNANTGANVSGGELQANDGLTVKNGAVIQTGQLEANAGLSVSGGDLEINDGVTVKNGAVIQTGQLEANAGATVSGGELQVNDGVTVKNGAVIQTGKLEANAGVTVNGALEANSGLTVTGDIVLSGATLVESGLLTANGGIAVTNNSVFSADGMVTLGNDDTGEVTVKGTLNAVKGIIVTGSELQAKEGAVISGHELKAIDGLKVYGGAAIETGVLEAKGGLTIPSESAFSAGGAVALGNAADGKVAINGELTATNGAVIGGLDLTAEKNVKVLGNLDVQLDTTLKNTTITTLTVTDLTITGDLSVQALEFNVIDVQNVNTVDMTTTGEVEILGPLQTSDNAVIGTGLIYVSYEGEPIVLPPLKVEKGSVANGDGHFDISISTAKQVKIIYNDTSDINNLITDWNNYRNAAPAQMAGFNLTRMGTGSWDLRDMEINFVSNETAYYEYLISDKGLRIIYAGSLTGIPQFIITENSDPAAEGFIFSINGLELNIKYPSLVANRNVARLLLDWGIWLSNNLECTGDFAIQQTGDTGELEITESSGSLVLNNASKNFYKGIIKTNSLTIKGILKFGSFTEAICGVSSDNNLVENSDSFLATQKAIKTYVDDGLSLKADQKYVVDELALKADQKYVDDELALKADQKYVVDGLSLKADQKYVVDELALKADQKYVDDGLALKADQKFVVDELALKADQKYVDDGLALKADQKFVVDELALKADQKYVVDELSLKADKVDLATKAGLQKLADLSIPAGLTDTVASIILTADSRGLMMIYIKKDSDGSTLGTGIFAVHGTDIVTKIAGDEMADQPDGSTFNVYFETTNLKVQNKSGDDVTVKVTYFGI